MSTRVTRLLPGGVPRYVRCYDNGGETADHFGWSDDDELEDC